MGSIADKLNKVITTKEAIRTSIANKGVPISEYASYTPEGINVGWTEFTHISDAMVYFKIFPKPISDEV